MSKYGTRHSWAPRQPSIRDADKAIAAKDQWHSVSLKDYAQMTGICIKALTRLVKERRALKEKDK